MKDVIEVIIGAVIGAIIGIFVKHVYDNRKLNKLHTKIQKMEKDYQDRLVDMRKILQQKDRLILELLTKNQQNAERIMEEVAKRERIIGIIDQLDRRLQGPGSLSLFTTTTESIAKCTSEFCTDEHPFSRENELEHLYDRTLATFGMGLSATAFVTGESSIATLDSSLAALHAPNQVLEHVANAQSILESAKEQAQAAKEQKEQK